MIFYTEFVALGCTWWIEIETVSKLEFDRLLESIKNNTEAFENTFSRFRKNSFIYELNQRKSMQIDNKELYEVISYGLTLAKKTRGLFTPLVGTVLENTGYDADYSFVSKNSTTGSLHVDEVYLTESKVVLGENYIFDIGGYGKGWLVDKISKYLIEQGVTKFMVNGSGDMYIYGYEYGPKTIYLEHPAANGMYIGEIQMTTGAVASSSTNRRWWKDQNGIEHTHIINPHNGQSNHKAIATYTSSSTCLAADVTSTILLIDPEFEIKKVFSDVEHLVVYHDNKFQATPGYLGKLYME